MRSSTGILPGSPPCAVLLRRRQQLAGTSVRDQRVVTCSPASLPPSPASLSSGGRLPSASGLRAASSCASAWQSAPRTPRPASGSAGIAAYRPPSRWIVPRLRKRSSAPARGSSFSCWDSRSAALQIGYRESRSDSAAARTIGPHPLPVRGLPRPAARRT